MRLFKEFYLQEFLDNRKKDALAEVEKAKDEKAFSELLEKYQVRHFEIDLKTREDPEILPTTIRGFEFPEEDEKILNKEYPTSVMRYHFKYSGDPKFIGARCRFNYLRDTFDYDLDDNGFYLDFQTYHRPNQIDEETRWEIKNQVSSLRDVFKMQTQQMNVEIDLFNRKLEPRMRDIFEKGNL